MRGCFQASLLGISVMTGSVSLYLPFNWHYLAIVTKAPGRKRKPIILQSSVICYCGKMLVPGEVFCGGGLILFVNCKSHVPGVRYFNFFMRSRASIPSHLHRCLRNLISQGFLVPYLFRIEHAAKIVLRNRFSQVWKSAVVWQAVTTKSLSTCKCPNKLATSR